MSFEITLEADQKCIKPKVKVSDNVVLEDIIQGVEVGISALKYIRKRLSDEGLTAAPLETSK